MPINNALQAAGNLTSAIQALYSDLNSVRTKMNSGPLQNEVQALCNRILAMVQEIKHLEQAIAFAGYDRDVERDGP